VCRIRRAIILEPSNHWSSPIGADDTLIRKLKNFANKRGTATYEVTGAVSPQDLRSVISSAEDLHKKVIEWLQQNHPELL
jgi:uncharacterized protein (UPF0332 family)